MKHNKHEGIRSLNLIKWLKITTSRFLKSKTSTRSIISNSLPGVPINKLAPSSSIIFTSAFTSMPPTSSMDLKFDKVAIKGCATLYICDDNSLVGEIIIPITC